MGYTNPCHHAYQLEQMGTSYQSELEIVILAIDNEYGIYLIDGSYLSLYDHNFGIDDLNSTMLKQGHPQWVLHGYPARPILEVDPTGVITFEDGTSLSQAEHKMTSTALVDLIDLL